MSKENTLSVQLTVTEARAILAALCVSDTDDLGDAWQRQRRALARGTDKLAEKVRAWERRRLETEINA